jgi:hypothetical protein
MATIDGGDLDGEMDVAGEAAARAAPATGRPCLGCSGATSVPKKRTQAGLVPPA